MALTLTTIGVKVSVAFESVAGVRPTTGYRIIPQAKSFPAMDSAPEQIPTTSFDNLKTTTYVPGLIDLGGSIAITANASNELDEFWEGTGGIMETWEEKKAAGLGMYLCVDVPNRNKAKYISVIPNHLGDGEYTVNSLVEAAINLTQAGEPIWGTKPTYEGTTAYNVTITGYAVSGVDIDVFKNDAIVANITTEDTSTIIKLPNGTYTAIARKTGKATQVEDFTVNGTSETVTFSTFA